MNIFAAHKNLMQSPNLNQIKAIFGTRYIILCTTLLNTQLSSIANVDQSTVNAVKQ